MQLFLRSLLLGIIVLPLGGIAQVRSEAGAGPTRCVVLVSQGANFSATDPSVNAKWNNANNLLGELARDELKQTDLEVAVLQLPVEATDRQQNAERVLAAAAERRCEGVVAVSIFAHPEDDQVLAVLRAYPVERQEVEGVERIRLGKEGLLKIETFPFRSNSLDRVVPSELAAKLARSFIGHAGLVRR